MVNAVTPTPIKITANSNCPFPVVNCNTGKKDLINSASAAVFLFFLGTGQPREEYSESHGTSP